MQTGTVKWFNDEKGFGFLVSEGKDYFVYYKEIKETGFKTLKEGQKVQFTAETSPKGACAKNITLVK